MILLNQQVIVNDRSVMCIGYDFKTPKDFQDCEHQGWRGHDCSSFYRQLRLYFLCFIPIIKYLTFEWFEKLTVFLKFKKEIWFKINHFCAFCKRK